MVGIVGLGMVGEPLRKWFEELMGYKRGKDLFCYDADPQKGYFDDINKAEVVFVAVPTPPNRDGSCNTSIVEAAVGKIKDGKIVVVKSTVEPGTVERLQNKYPKKRFIFNPEFLTESQAWNDFLSPDRQIIGTTAKSAPDAIRVLKLLPKIKTLTPNHHGGFVNATEAEMGKYASNIFGYMKVVYGNILADISHAMNYELKNNKTNAKVNYNNIKNIIGADLRIGHAWLNVEHGNYCGAGGYCFPKDMNAFISFSNLLAKNIEKRKVNKEFIKTLKKGISVLESVRDYNTELLNWQGLTIEDVSKHNKEIIVQKRKVIRDFHGKK